MSVITFPKDKTGLPIPGVGPLETGDKYKSTNGVLYYYDAVNNSWTGTFPVIERPPEPPVDETSNLLQESGSLILGDGTGDMGLINEILIDEKDDPVVEEPNLLQESGWMILGNGYGPNGTIDEIIVDKV